MQELGVGIVGFGFIGKVHTYAYKSIPLFYDPPPLKTKLVGVCTAHTETAQKAKVQGEFEFATTNFHELLDRDDIHIINCCTPNYLHKDLLIEAMRSGKHIYCDKPLAFSAAEAKEIAEISRTCGGRYQMTFQSRFLPAILRAKQLTDEGLLGRIFQFRAAYLHSGYIDSNRPMNWRLNKSEGGGGALYDLGSHILDLMYHLIGDFTNVFAICETMIRERPITEGALEMSEVKVDDFAILNLRAKNGAVGIVEASRLATGTNDEMKFEIHGDKGAMKFNLMEPNWLYVYDCRDAGGHYGGNRGFKRIEAVQRYPEPAILPAPKVSIGWIRGHIACLHNFLKCIADDRPTSPDFVDGARIQEIMDAAYRSSESKEWVEV